MRPIDADKLKEEISSLEMVITGLRAGKGVLVEFMKEYRKSILRIVDDAPTIDAVEVIRCKDCKYYGTDGCALDRFAFDVVEEGFCSYGERKE